MVRVMRAMETHNLSAEVQVSDGFRVRASVRVRVRVRVRASVRLRVRVMRAMETNRSHAPQHDTHQSIRVSIKVGVGVWARVSGSVICGPYACVRPRERACICLFACLSLSSRARARACVCVCVCVCVGVRVTCLSPWRA